MMTVMPATARHYGCASNDSWDVVVSAPVRARVSRDINNILPAVRGGLLVVPSIIGVISMASVAGGIDGLCVGRCLGRVVTCHGWDGMSVVGE